jgi:hypothetical protein
LHAFHSITPVQRLTKKSFQVAGASLALAFLAGGCAAGNSAAPAPSTAAATDTASTTVDTSVSPSSTATQTGESWVADPNAKLPQDIEVSDVSVSPGFTLGKEQGESAIALSLNVLSLYTSEFPQYQEGDFPAAPIGDLLANEVAPKLRPLSTDQYWSDESNRFLATDGKTMIMTSIFSTDGSDPHKVELTEGSCTASDDESFEVKYVNSELRGGQAIGTNEDMPIFHTTGHYLIQCKEGKLLFAKMDTDIYLSRSVEGGWLTAAGMRSVAREMKLVTVLNK